MLAAEIVGHCLEPLLSEGDYVLADRDRSPTHGALVVVRVDATEEVICKYWQHRSGRTALLVPHPGSHIGHPQEFDEDGMTLLTGLRMGELRGLLRQNVALDGQPDGGGWLHIRQQITRVEGRDVQRKPKTGRLRDVPVPPQLARLLREHLDSHPHALVFADAAGSPFSYDRARRGLHAILRKADLPDRTPHELRHSFATLALAAGISLSYVSWALGHSDTRITSRYTHFLHAVGAAEAHRLATYIGGAAAETQK